MEAGDQRKAVAARDGNSSATGGNGTVDDCVEADGSGKEDGNVKDGCANFASERNSREDVAPLGAVAVKPQETAVEDHDW